MWGIVLVVLISIMIFFAIGVFRTKESYKLPYDVPPYDVDESAPIGYKNEEINNEMPYESIDKELMRLQANAIKSNNTVMDISALVKHK